MADDRDAPGATQDPLPLAPAHVVHVGVVFREAKDSATTQKRNIQTIKGILTIDSIDLSLYIDSLDVCRISIEANLRCSITDAVVVAVKPYSLIVDCH